MMPSKFRETLWFKKGDLDAKAAQAGGDEPIGAADLLPIEDRYLDDGSVNNDDSAAFSMRTGSTQFVPVVGDVAPAAASEASTLHVLVREMKRRRGMFAAMGASVIAATTAVLLYTL